MFQWYDKTSLNGILTSIQLKIHGQNGVTYQFPIQVDIDSAEKAWYDVRKSKSDYKIKVFLNVQEPVFSKIYYEIKLFKTTVKKSWMTQDPLFSVVGLSNTSGELGWEFDYDPKDKHEYFKDEHLLFSSVKDNFSKKCHGYHSGSLSPQQRILDAGGFQIHIQ